MGKITLAAARVNKGFTQKYAAKCLKISNKTLSNWEQGNSYPKAKHIDAICTLYGCTYEDIIFFKDNPL